MYSQPVRYSQLRLLIALIAIVWTVGGALLVLLGGLGLSTGQETGLWLVIVGGESVLAALVLAALSFLLLKIEAQSARQYDALRDVYDSLAHQARQIEVIGENTRIPDAAKSVAHRDQELNALREALREDIRRSDWEAATRLVEEMERRFGYRQEAESFREEIQAARADAMRRRLDEAAELVSRLITDNEWAKARREIDRLNRILPDEPRVAEIESEFHHRHELHKQSLLKSWSEAVRRDDIDEGINILKALDQHLTRDEAQSLQSSARELFKEKLKQLGVQFRFAVKEKRWRDALEVGLELLEEFPNTRMAREVSDHIDSLRKRAGMTSDVEVVAREAR